jgi:hypothetical protein
LNALTRLRQATARHAFQRGEANFPRKGSKNFLQYFSERSDMTTQ